MIMSIGASPFAMQAAGSVIGILMNRSLSLYGGSIAIGAYAAINSVVTLFFMPIFGMNQGLQPIIGFNYGAKNYTRVKEALKVGIISATVVCTIGYIFVQLVPHVFIDFITKDPDIREMGVLGIRRFMLLMPVIGMQIISSNFFQAIGKAKKSFFLAMSRQVIFLIPLILIENGIGVLWCAKLKILNNDRIRQYSLRKSRPGTRSSFFELPCFRTCYGSRSRLGCFYCSSSLR